MSATAPRLAPGTRLGPYEILASIGAGGMGEVYKARDTKLQRDVAIKVLSASVAGNPKRLVRFEREARALAALNHPNIATVYGIEVPAAQSDQARAIVMELVDGEDLSRRLKRGALGISEALGIARQVAEALAAAHEAGIVHRDLKPANIKVREDGSLKVLDFGLAKSEPVERAADAAPGWGSGSGSDSSDLAATLTMSSEITADGDVLGTAAYMAPEQAKGRVVDKRADIWAFGVVLFEMLSGKRPFAGEDAAEIVARVLAAEPDWRLLPVETPAPIRRLLSRCLVKERRARLHDIADARLEIDEALSHKTPATPFRTIAWRWLPVAAGVALGVAIGAIVMKPVPTIPPATFARLDVNPAAELTSGGIHPSVVLPPGGAHTAMAWSPDGRTLAFIGQRDGVRQIYLRELGRDSARALAGTEGAQMLAFSPDGEQVAFWNRNVIRRVRVTGGPVVAVSASTSGTGGMAWGDSGLVVAGGALFKVSLEGGAVTPLSVSNQLIRLASPSFLPGERALIYTQHERQWTSGDERVMVLPLEGGAPARQLLANASHPRYLSTGHIAFMRQGALYVVPFDLSSLEVRGDPVPVLKDVAQSVVAWDSDDLTLAGQFAVSQQGTLAYVSSPLPSYPDREIVTVDRHGKITPVGAPIRGYRHHLKLSPDATKLAVSIQTTTDIHVYQYDLVRGSLSRIAESIKGEVVLGDWSANNDVLLGVIDQGTITSAIAVPDDASPPVRVPDTVNVWPGSLSSNGIIAAVGGGNILLIPARPAAGISAAVIQTPANEYQPAWSPDGKWLAYSSDSTGRQEVFVRPYPGPGENIMVSLAGGSSPAWSPDTHELFYLEPGADKDRMMVVNVSTPARPGKPVALFSYERDGLFLGTQVFTPFAVAPGGQKIYAISQRPRVVTPITQISLVFNWFEELRSRGLVK